MLLRREKRKYEKSKEVGHKTLVLKGPKACWRNFKKAMLQPTLKYVYVISDGNYEIEKIERTFFLLDDCIVLSTCGAIVIDEGDLQMTLEELPEKYREPSYKVKSMRLLDMWLLGSPDKGKIKIFFCDSCYSLYTEDEDPDPGDYSIDMFYFLGMGVGSPHWGTYVGWKVKSWSAAASPYNKWVQVIYRHLANGDEISQAIIKAIDEVEGRVKDHLKYFGNNWNRFR